MERGRLLIIGREKDAVYAIRNVFELEKLELELALGLDVGKAILVDRHIDLIIMDPHIGLEEDFDLLDFQLDHGLKVPICIVGGESTGVRRRIRSKQGIKVHSVPADGFKLIDFVRAYDLEPA